MNTEMFSNEPNRSVHCDLNDIIASSFIDLITVTKISFSSPSNLSAKLLPKQKLNQK